MKLELTTRLVFWMFAAGVIMGMLGYQVGKWLALTTG